MGKDDCRYLWKYKSNWVFAEHHVGLDKKKIDKDDKIFGIIAGPRC